MMKNRNICLFLSGCEHFEACKKEHDKLKAGDEGHFTVLGGIYSCSKGSPMFWEFKNAQ